MTSAIDLVMERAKVNDKPISLFKKFGSSEIKAHPMPANLTKEERGSYVHIPGAGMCFYTGD